jgi:hypothetical protein
MRFSKWNKDKGKLNETVLDSNLNLTKSMTHHNQTKELTTWFLNLLLDESIDNKRYKVWSLNPRPHEAQLEEQKTYKSSKRSSRRKKSRKASKRHEKQQSQETWQRRAKKSLKERKDPNQSKSLKLILLWKSTPPNSLNASSPP